jgi:hypothetical protein
LDFSNLQRHPYSKQTFQTKHKHYSTDKTTVMKTCDFIKNFHCSARRRSAKFTN